MDSYEQYKRKQAEADVASANVATIFLLIIIAVVYFIH